MNQLGYAVVTGASSGIGAASARALAKEGYQVIAAARRTDMLADLAKSDDRIHAWELDVTDQKSVDALAALIRRRFPCELDPPERADTPWRLTIVTT